jgi:DNA (cytosine-5)-methyltransferase 1
VARAAEVFNPTYVMIENVPGVIHDRGAVVDGTADHLRSLGYSVDGAVLSADRLGLAQTRKRFFLAASSRGEVDLRRAIAEAETAERPVTWAIEDLSVDITNSPFDTPSDRTAITDERIGFLFDRRLYELPDEMRPSCHRDKPHTYKSVYGRMRPDKPAPTITMGFGTMGQGRFVHPTERRTLTPHEAARIQGFPDWFSFDDLSRSQLHKAIGNAVPPKLAQVVTEHLLRQ